MSALQHRDREAPRRVLISSRIDELGSARRAAFRAVHDEGWIPLLYEVEPDEWLATSRQAASGDQQAIQNSIRMRTNERLSMDRLLDTADHFIGIYGTSLGDPSPQLCGLRPLEYELLRFVDVHESRARGMQQASLTYLFSTSSSPDNCYIARYQLQQLFAAIGNDGNSRAQVFSDRVVMFMRDNSGDSPASSLLYSSLLRLPRGGRRSVVQKFRSRPKELPTGETVFWRPSLDLYLKVRERVRAWRGDPAIAVERVEAERPCWLHIQTLDKIGALLAIVKVVFLAGYNVLDIEMGKETGDIRVVYLCIAPYLHRSADILKAFQRTPYKVMKCPGKPGVVRKHNVDGEVWELEAVVADRPGMLTRILTALASMHLRVIDVVIDPNEARRGSASNGRATILLTFERVRTHNDAAGGQDIDHPRVDPELALDFLAAELTSLPGFYAVKPPQPVAAPRVTSRDAIRQPRTQSEEEDAADGVG